MKRYRGFVEKINKIDEEYFSLEIHSISTEDVLSSNEQIPLKKIISKHDNKVVFNLLSSIEFSIDDDLLILEKDLVHYLSIETFHSSNRKYINTEFYSKTIL